VNAATQGRGYGGPAGLKQDLAAHLLA